MTTLSQLANRAIDVQDACNLSGVLYDFREAIVAIREIMCASAEGCSTDKLNRHPICIMYASKVADLTGLNYDSVVFGDAYRKCKVMAGRT